MRLASVCNCDGQVEFEEMNLKGLYIFFAACRTDILFDFDPSCLLFVRITLAFRDAGILHPTMAKRIRLACLQSGTKNRTNWTDENRLRPFLALRSRHTLSWRTESSGVSRLCTYKMKRIHCKWLQNSSDSVCAYNRPYAAARFLGSVILSVSVDGSLSNAC